MKPGAIIAAILAVGGLLIGVYAFVAGASPYVTAKEAASKPGEEVNVAGTIDHASSKIASGKFSFELIDDSGDRLKVVQYGMKPGNFDSAPTASVKGTYKNGVFVAKKITTQCPSKYVSEPGNVVSK